MTQQQYVFAHDPEKHRIFQTLHKMAVDRGVQPSPELDSLLVAIADGQVKVKYAMVEDIRKWVEWNKSDLGEIGVFIRTKYVHNKLDMIAPPPKEEPVTTGFVCLEGDDYQECM